MQVVRCSALAASASILQQLINAFEAGAGGQHPAEEGVQHTSAKSVSRAVCILDGPIQVQIPALLSLDVEYSEQAEDSLRWVMCSAYVLGCKPIGFGGFA